MKALSTIGFVLMSTSIVQAQGYNTFTDMNTMIDLMRPIAVQSAVEHCPTYFSIADRKAHAEGLALAKKTFTNPGDYHYNTLKARADKSYKTDKKRCDKDREELKVDSKANVVFKK